MENNEKILAKADVKFTPSKKARTIYYWSVIAVAVLGLVCGSHISGNGLYVSWFYALWFGNEEEALLFFAILIVLFVIPTCIRAIWKSRCKKTALYVSESYVYGTYSGFLTKKSLKMPIEKVDNLTNSSNLFDKLRSGTTIGVCSASGIIRFHFVHNAEEVISAAMNRINELKTTPKTATAPNVSTSDKIKELLSLKESGLITEEEFTAKKDELLSKM